MASTIWKTAQNVYFYTANALSPAGKTIAMESYKNKVLLIVNVASEWGLTKQNYKELNELHEKYNNQGLEIIAQPCNQFGSQEPLEGQDLYNHITSKYQPKFMENYFARNDVNGKNASELFLYLQNHKNCPGFMGINSIKWNFSKFLIGKDGVPIKRFGPKENPLGFEKHIVKALGNDVQ